MITNILISKLGHDGFRVFQTLHYTDKVPEQKLLVETMRFRNKNNNIFEYKSKDGLVFTVYYSYLDDPTQRPNLYALHFTVEKRLANFEGLLKSLALQFQENGLHKFEILDVLFENLNKRENLSFPVNSNTNEVSIQWDLPNQGGIDEIW